MTETKATHTPGPWYAQGTAGHEKHGQSVIYCDTGTDIAFVYDGARNANLIAAAPEMFHWLQNNIGALRAASIVCETNDHPCTASELRKMTGEVEELVCKAKGE